MKRFFEIVFEELLSNGLGWVVGLLSSDLVSYFFVAKSWRNAWGLFALKREAVNRDTLGVMEWVVAAIIGFIVLTLVNRYVGKVLKNRKFFVSKRK